MSIQVKRSIALEPLSQCLAGALLKRINNNKRNQMNQPLKRVMGTTQRFTYKLDGKPRHFLLTHGDYLAIEDQFERGGFRNVQEAFDNFTGKKGQEGITEIRLERCLYDNA